MTNETDIAVDSPSQVQAPVQSLGETLASLRTARGLTLAEISSRIKFSETQLRALESQNWASLPTGFMLRGMVKKYAQVLETDEQPLVQLLGQQPGIESGQQPAANTAAGTNINLKRSTDYEIRDSRSGRSNGTGLWLFVILLVLVVIAVYGFTRGWYTLQDIGLESLQRWFE
ncbi:membrane protein [Advenella kashmirensis W13003]|uniref:Membrane protein n=1 Tax=Advenella kashmirensis W13003 TaxID=1424334 RepID=V8QT43_9BURK|nr:helix-turn-helix transcriptional regulator [Advenella kashmirensis]ETF02169.1 membrane protein [Advenella kashmirensis W13003]